MSEEELAAAVDELIEALVDRWHAGDSTGYAAHFHEGADFVDVLGRQVRGRETIAVVHRRNFDTIHLGSRLAMSRVDSTLLAEGLALAHFRGTISVPAGPLAGEHDSTQPAVLENVDGAWQRRAFHTTFARELAGAPALPRPV